jgi:alkanesulfonate monooxygenase SsuD/methylene tetrahydromethanopterin reductase-like flavin-dependent oxidoreductase (luciferase family)
MYAAFGVPAVTTAQMEDFAQVMRRLWNGEVIFNHDGPIGKYQVLFLDPDFKEDIRLAIVAFGPRTLALGGRVFDDVILHTYFTPETLQRCVKTVKDAAEKAGRDPDSVRVWSCFATVGDHLPEELRLKKNRRPTGDLPTGLRRPAGQHQRLGPRCAATVSGRLRSDVHSGRDRPQGHCRADRAHRHTHPG